MKSIRDRLSEPGVRPSAVKKMLAFVVFAEMMGYKAEFAYIHAVKLAQRGSLAEKKMGKEKIFVIGLKVLIGIHLSNCMIIVHYLKSFLL